jgi:hydroxymethylpyrimidine/phosphomethylpyrimidine kinase
MMTATAIPVVVAISGLDPTGGAGIQADIEALASMGCHTAPLITALTIQTTGGALGYEPVDAGLLRRQLDAVLGDMTVSACKIGMLGSPAIVRTVHKVLRDHSHIPVILDPVLIAGGGGALADTGTREAMLDLLVPLATMITPNTREAGALAPQARDIDARARALVERGAEFCLVTGADEPTEAVINRLYDANGHVETWNWERLPGSYHGSGCTLAAATAGLIAHGTEPRAAVREAQEYTWETLRQGYRIGAGQTMPNRLFWALYDKGIAN